jgi:hypothetical protein
MLANPVGLCVPLYCVAMCPHTGIFYDWIVVFIRETVTVCLTGATCNLQVCLQFVTDKEGVALFY